MEKVYCKNCKYALLYSYCSAKYLTKDNDYTGEKHLLPYERTILNKNGECKYYKKKWWKL